MTETENNDEPMKPTERLRLPLGPVCAGAADHPEVVPGPAVVRGGHRALHQPRQRAETADRVRRARREAPVLGRHVSAPEWPSFCSGTTPNLDLFKKIPRFSTATWNVRFDPNDQPPVELVGYFYSQSGFLFFSFPFRSIG